jgi:Flp pilus assembly protein TadD
VQAAIDVFRWVVEIYPRSPNAYDSLGDAYAAAGQSGLAAENARKALQLLDAAPGLNESQRNNIKRSAESKLKSFR